MDIEHVSPINLQASKVFWKCPWWAKAPPEERKAIEKSAEKLDYKTLIDYTKAPPIVPREYTPVMDRRGFTVLWSDGNAGRVIGYAETKIIHREKNFPNGIRKMKTERVLFWWVIDQNGEFIKVKCKANGKHTKARFYPPCSDSSGTGK